MYIYIYAHMCIYIYVYTYIYIYISLVSETPKLVEGTKGVPRNGGRK